MTTTDTQRVMDALAVLRGLRDSELALLLDEAQRGEAEGLEWASARAADLQEAAEALRAVSLSGLDAGGWATLLNLATQEGVTYAAARQRLETGGRYEVVDGPSRGRGPRVQRYARVLSA
jgi:hypothetical protein